MSVKCRNRRCSWHSGSADFCLRPQVEFDYEGRCMTADYEQAPYEECGRCQFDHKQCRASINSKFCVDFEEEEK
jgi:hypothetical protein